MRYADVLVIGAGLAGLRSARHLAQLGLEVALADVKEDVSTGVRTTGIFVRRTLDSFSLPGGVLGPPVRDVTLFSPIRRRPLHLHSSRGEFRLADMAALYSAELDLCVAAGVHWLPGRRYERLVCLQRDSIAEFRRCAGHVDLVRARFIVAADGVFSRTARDLRLGRNTEWIQAIEYVSAERVLDGPPCLHCFLDPALAPGYIGWVASDGVKTHVGVGGYPPLFEGREALERFKAVAGTALAEHGWLNDSRRLGRMRVEQHRGGCIPVGGIVPGLASRRGLLVGDAAGAPSPLTAGGLDPCLRLSRHAAEVTAAYLVEDDASALAAYGTSSFRPAFSNRLRLRTCMKSLKDPWLMEALCLGFSLPGARRAVEHVFFADRSFPDERALVYPPSSGVRSMV